MANKRKSILAATFLGLVIASFFTSADEPSATDIYHFQPGYPSGVTGAMDLIVTDDKIKAVPGKKGEVDSEMKLNATVGGSTEVIKYYHDALGSKNIHVHIDGEDKTTTYAGLTFKEDVIVGIWQDGTVELNRENITAFDKSGARFVSRSVVINGTSAIVMVAALSPAEQDSPTAEHSGTPAK